MSKYLTLSIFVFFTVAGGALIGAQNVPGDWYDGLTKPFFNPPPWIFGPVWTVLYFMIAIAGWRSWERRAESAQMQVWFAQMAVNFIWSPIFFNAQSIGFALVVIIVLLFLILAFIAIAWNRDRVAALLFMPYAAWVSFATLLNASLFWLN